jgi:hypothetical protein
MHTQQRTATWVDQTEEHRPEFGSAITSSSLQGTPPMLQPRPLHRRGNHSMHERRRPSFSSSSDSSSSSSTSSSDWKVPAPMPAFQPRYLQHPVADPLQSNIYHRSDPQHQSSHSHSSSYVTPTPAMYGHTNGHSSSGVASQLLKGISPMVSHFLLISDVTADTLPDLTTAIPVLSAHTRLSREGWIPF